MTTDPIDAARALIEPLREHREKQAVAGGGWWWQAPEICTKAADAIVTLAVALEAERAKVATAYEAASYRARVHRDPSLVGLYWDGVNKASRIIEDSIRSLTPADAQAALDTKLAEARAEGWRAGRDADLVEALEAENQRLRVALRIIAGYEQGLNNLMSHADLARAVLAGEDKP